MPRKPKSPSLAKVARNYRKNTKPSSDIYSMGKKVKSDGRIPVVSGPRVPDTKLKAKSMTYGGTRKGKGATIKKRGTV